MFQTEAFWEPSRSEDTIRMLLVYSPVNKDSRESHLRWRFWWGIAAHVLGKDRGFVDNTEDGANTSPPSESEALIVKTICVFRMTSRLRVLSSHKRWVALPDLWMLSFCHSWWQSYTSFFICSPSISVGRPSRIIMNALSFTFELAYAEVDSCFEWAISSIHFGQLLKNLWILFSTFTRNLITLRKSSRSIVTLK